MPDAQTIYELRLALHKSGCPVCTLVQRAGARYVEGTLNESILDPAVRQKLVLSQGFCYEHIWMSINLKLSDALGHAILQLDLINAMISKIEEMKPGGSEKLVTALADETDCPACLIEHETLERVIESLAHGMQNQNFEWEYMKSDCLCFPHLRRLLPYLKDNQRTEILRYQHHCMKSLQDELEEFIRKSDYRFRDEVIGREGDSYKRAADMVKGKRRPTGKNDLR